MNPSVRCLIKKPSTFDSINYSDIIQRLVSDKIVIFYSKKLKYIIIHQKEISLAKASWLILCLCSKKTHIGSIMGMSRVPSDKIFQQNRHRSCHKPCSPAKEKADGFTPRSITTFLYEPLYKKSFMKLALAMVLILSGCARRKKPYPTSRYLH